MSQFKPHPAAELLPRPTADEQSALASDIKAHGLLHPIVIIAGTNGEELVLDGLSRQAALDVLNIEISAQHIRKIEPGKNFDPVAYVLSTNLHRRHLNGEQKRELAGKVLKLRPEQSDRQVAATLGIDHKTVGEVRTNLETNGEIPHKDRVEKTGRKARGHKPSASSKPKKPKGGPTVTALNSMSWSEANEQARQKFVNGVGLKHLFNAAPPEARHAFLAVACKTDVPTAAKLSTHHPIMHGSSGRAAIKAPRKSAG